MAVHITGQALDSGSSLESAESNRLGFTTYFQKDLSCLQLRQAHFIGVLPSLSPVFLSQLESLTLESCPGILKFLCAMRENYLDNLKKFRLRQKNLDLPAFMELKAFLQFFTGLRHLSILINKMYGVISSSAIEVILRGHMPTLQSIVWDY